jgi:hypothetical protein
MWCKPGQADAVATLRRELESPLGLRFGFLDALGPGPSPRQVTAEAGRRAAASGAPGDSTMTRSVQGCGRPPLAGVADCVDTSWRAGWAASRPCPIGIGWPTA